MDFLHHRFLEGDDSRANPPAKTNLDSVKEGSLMGKLTDTGLYTSDESSFPPAEGLPHVVQFEVTAGCKHNRCTYCTLFKGVKFHQKDFGEYKKHVDGVWDGIRRLESPSALNRLERIFIGGGDALCVDTNELKKMIRYTIDSFLKNVGRLPKRTAIYGNTQDLLKKGREQLEILNCGGVCGNCSLDYFGTKKSLDLVYWGIESGSDDVLKYVGKGCTTEDLEKAAKSIPKTVSRDIRVSAMIMPGLGGMKYYDKHVSDTVKIINSLGPEFLTFMSIKMHENSSYARRMQEEERAGINRPLKPYELAQQILSMMEGLRISTRIGCYGREILPEAANPIEFGPVNYVYYNPGNLLKQIGKQTKRLKRT